MARKSNTTAGSSSDIYFDTRTKAVMTHVDKYSNEQLKEKIATVREVVPNKSNDEIVLVLQHFDGDPEKAIRSFTDDGAVEVLNEWSYQGKKGKTSNKKNKKKKSKQPPQEKETDTKSGDVVNTVAVVAKQPVPTKQTVSTKPISENPVKQNTTNVDTQASTSAGEKKASSSAKPDSKVSTSGSAEGAPRPEVFPFDPVKTAQVKDHKRHQHDGGKHTRRERTISEKSTGNEKSEKKTGGALDKSAKDLQRTSVSLGHHRNKQEEEMENAFKKIKDAFVEVHKLLETREVNLMRELTSIKKQAVSMFDERQHKAAELKRRADQVKFLNDLQLLELRADIKHFVSDRKVDEALARTSRFQADASALEEQVNEFGEVTPITCQYSTRRPSLTSLSSTVSRSTSVNEDLLSPLGRADAFTEFVNGVSSGKAIPTAASKIKMTAAEMGELQNKLLLSLKAQGLPVPKSPPHRNKGRNTKGPNQNQQLNKAAENRNKTPVQDRPQNRQQERPNDRHRQKDRQHDKLQDRQNDRQQNKVQDRQSDKLQDRQNDKVLDRQKDTQQNKVPYRQRERQWVRQNDKQEDRQNDKQDQRHTDSQTTKIVRRREQYRRRKRERENVSDTDVNDEKLSSIENGIAEKESAQTKEHETKSVKPNKSTRTRNYSPEKKQGSQNKTDDTPEKKVENNNKVKEKKTEVENVVENAIHDNGEKIKEDSQKVAETQKTDVEHKPVTTNGTWPASPKEKRAQRSPRRKQRPASVPNGVILNGHTEKDHDTEDVTNNNKGTQDNAPVKCVVNSTTEVKTEKLEQPIQNGHVNSVAVDE